MSMMYRTTHCLTPVLPNITLTARAGRLVGLQWATQSVDTLKVGLEQPVSSIDLAALAEPPNDPTLACLAKTIAQLTDYVKGTRQRFDLPLDLSQGTPFQQRVWQALLAIPYGTTISYAELANAIGQPTAYRAVAGANAKNPIGLIVPCHRVIASDGGLGGYTGGLAIKAQLLAIEHPKSP